MRTCGPCNAGTSVPATVRHRLIGGHMDSTIDIRGHPTWIDERGEGGDPIVLLHGGLSHSDTLLDAIGDALAADHRLVSFDRRGHGYTADTDAPFHYDDMAIETIGVLEQVVGGRAHLVGWSDGGIVALLVALRRPDLVDRLVLIGVNFRFDGMLPLDVTPEMGAMLAQSYAERAPEGAAPFEVVVAKFMTMVTTEPTLTTDDLRRVSAPALVLVGDDDLIALAHTCELYESLLPAGQLAIVPGASHALPLEQPDETTRIVLRFLAAPLPPATMMPIRRVPRPAAES